jgi:hypothetical protein
MFPSLKRWHPPIAEVCFVGSRTRVVPWVAGAVKGPPRERCGQHVGLAAGPSPSTRARCPSSASSASSAC